MPLEIICTMSGVCFKGAQESFSSADGYKIVYYSKVVLLHQRLLRGKKRRHSYTIKIDKNLKHRELATKNEQKRKPDQNQNFRSNNNPARLPSDVLLSAPFSRFRLGNTP